MQTEHISHLAQKYIPWDVFSVILQTFLTTCLGALLFMCHSGKGKKIGMEERSVIARTGGWGGVTPEGQPEGGCGVRRLFCVLLWSS